MGAIHDSTDAAPTAAPICYAVTSSRSFVRSAPAVQGLLCIIRAGQRLWAFKMRHALTAGPPNLSTGSRQLLRASLSACITKRGPEFTPYRCTWGRGHSRQSQSTHNSDTQQALTAVLCAAPRRSGAWRVQLRSSNRSSRDGLIQTLNM